MRRVVLAAAAAAALAVVAGSGTFAGTFSTTKSNSASLSSQSVFPPINTAVPTVTVTAAGLTRTATLGSWATPSALTTSYTVRWERCTAVNVCTDINEVTSGLTSLLSTVVHTIVPADSGNTLRVKVIGTNTAASPVSSTSVYSAQVS